MTVLSSPDEQVAYESRVRLRYAATAFVAGLLVVASLLVQEIGFHNHLTEETAQLIQIHKRAPLDAIGAVLDALGLLALGYVLWWLNAISLARDPKLSPITRYLVLVGAPLMSVLEVASIIIYTFKSASFVNGGNLGYPEAYHLIHPLNVVFAVCSLGQELGALLLAAGFIWTALSAMRVGLLPRPMGYAGVIAGALVIFAIGPISFVVQGVWLVSAAVLISGRWPNEPPAWREGVAIPWLAGGKPNFDAAGAPAPAVAGDAPVASPPRSAARASTSAQQSGDYTPRRKKKKR